MACLNWQGVIEGEGLDSMPFSVFKRSRILAAVIAVATLSGTALSANIAFADSDSQPVFPHVEQSASVLPNPESGNSIVNASLTSTGSNAVQTSIRSSDGWSINPDHGPATGNTKVTLTRLPQGPTFSQVAFGEDFILLLASDGNLYGAGTNDTFILSPDSNLIQSDTPVLIKKPEGAPQDFTWKQICAGSRFAVALGSDNQLYSWGYNALGYLGIGSTTGPLVNWSYGTPQKVHLPQGVSDDFSWKQVIMRGDFTMAFGSDGNLYAWGGSYFGQLGNGTSQMEGNFTLVTSPIRVLNPSDAPTDFKWKQISVGKYSVMGLGSNNKLYAWGSYATGGGVPVTGGDTDDHPSKPTQVVNPDGESGDLMWKQFSAGQENMAAIDSNGRLFVWGMNYGQIPSAEKSQYVTKPTLVAPPADAPQGFTWTKVITADGAILAFGSNGVLYSWGCDNNGVLGRGVVGTMFIPIGAVSNPAGVSADFTYKDLACSTGTSCIAIGSDGLAYTWGLNLDGSLGRGPDSEPPYDVPGKVVAPKATTYVTSVTFDKTPSVTEPQKQDDRTWTVTAPPHAAGLVDVTIIWNVNNETVQTSHLAYRYDAPAPQTHHVRFDADNGSPVSSVQVVDGDRVAFPAVPSRDGFVFDGWFLGDVAYDFSRPVTADMDLKAHWSPKSGWIISPRRGPDTGGDEVTLTPPALRGIRFSRISTGNSHTLAMGSDGNTYAWGMNTYGQMGNGIQVKKSVERPVLVNKPDGVPAGFRYTLLASGASYSLAMGSDDKLYGWGKDVEGVLGDGKHTEEYSVLRPTEIPMPAGAPSGLTYTQLSAADSFVLALGSDGNIYGWGMNTFGALGIGVSGGLDDCRTPVKALKPDGAPEGFTWKAVSAGGNAGLALGSDGKLYEWGKDTAKSRPTLVDDSAGAPAYTQISRGTSHFMALGTDGKVYTWGNNNKGQLGDGTSSNRDKPAKVDMPPDAPAKFTQVSAGGDFSTALAADGTAYAWGMNDYGTLGDGSLNTKLTPTKVSGGLTYDSLSATNERTQAIGTDGNTYGWGNNQGSEFGSGTEEPKQVLKPLRTAFPGRGEPTKVLFDQNQGTSLNKKADGTWMVTTPAHTAGTVTTTIQWTLNGAQQPDDTTNTYEYTTHLPLTGGSGILLILLIGLATMAGALVVKHDRQAGTPETVAASE